MNRLAFVLALIPGLALAQSQVRTPDGSSISLLTPACINGAGLAVACSPSNPLPVAGTVTAAPSGTPQPVTQSGTWTTTPYNGTPSPSAVTSVGTTVATVFAAGNGLRYKLIQNQSSTQALYCRHDGVDPTAAPPAFMIQPLQIWAQGQAPGFVTSAAVKCIAASGTNPIAAWSAS